MANQVDYMPGYQAGPNGAATRAEVIVPDDGHLLPFVVRTIWVGTGGDIRLTPRDNLKPVTISNVPGGKVLEVTARQVFATGTTASGLVGLV